MNEKKQLSIKINGKEPIEKTKAHQEASVSDANSENFHWVLPKNTQAQGVKNIKEYRKGSGKRKKKLNGQAPSLPIHRKKKAGGHKRKKIKRTHHIPKSQWLSGLFAIVIGVIMGLIVLSIFTNPHHLKHDKTLNTFQSLQQTSEPANQEEGLTPATQLDLSLQVVQGGVYSSVANGQDAEKELKSGGFAAVLNQMNGKVYMFIGISADKTQAEAIANLYKQNDQDVWVKPFSVQVNKGRLNHKTSQILSEAKLVIVKILKGCGNGFSGEDTSVSDEEWQKLQAQIEKLKQDETKATQPLVENLVQASAYFKKYRGDSKLAYLWQVQQSLLLAVENYKQLGSGN